VWQVLLNELGSFTWIPAAGARRTWWVLSIPVSFNCKVRRHTYRDTRVT
jgi:hypothetical protein